MRASVEEEASQVQGLESASPTGASTKPRRPRSEPSTPNYKIPDRRNRRDETETPYEGPKSTRKRPPIVPATVTTSTIRTCAIMVIISNRLIPDDIYV